MKTKKETGRGENKEEKETGRGENKDEKQEEVKTKKRSRKR